MERKMKIISAVIIVMIAISGFSTWFAFLGPNSLSVKGVTPEVAKGLQILQTLGLSHEAYTQAAANIMTYLYPGDYGFVAFSGQGITEIDNAYSNWEATAMAFDDELNRLIVGGLIAPEALDVATALYDVTHNAMYTVWDTIGAVPITPPELILPITPMYPAIIKELPFGRCPNWWWPRYHEPQVDEKEAMVYRGWASFVVVQKMRGIKQFLVWWWWPIVPIYPIDIDVVHWPYWVYGVVWLPVEYIKTIIVTPGRTPTVETIQQIKIDYEIADFAWFFAKDP